MHHCQRCGASVVLDDLSHRRDLALCLFCADDFDQLRADEWRSEQLVSSYLDEGPDFTAEVPFD